MVQSATALLACGRVDTARRALVYLACTQKPDGSFAQNFWINGTPYWSGIQLDEVAFPIILAWRLWKLDGSGRFRRLPVRRACRRVPRAPFPGHPAGALGRGSRLLALHPVGGDLRFDLRRRYRARPREQPNWPNFSKSMRTGLKLTSKTGRSPITVLCYPASRGTTCAFVRPSAETHMRTRAATSRSSASTTAAQGSKFILRPATWSMRASWNWCATGCAAPTIRYGRFAQGDRPRA